MDIVFLTIKILNMILDKNDDQMYISKILPISKVSFLQEDYLIQFEGETRLSSYTSKIVRTEGIYGDSENLLEHIATVRSCPLYTWQIVGKLIPPNTLSPLDSKMFRRT